MENEVIELIDDESNAMQTDSKGNDLDDPTPLYESYAIED